MNNVLKMRQTIKYLREIIAKDMPLQQLAVFLEVCANEGISMKELAKTLGMPQSSITRNVKRLCQFKNGTKMEGYLTKSRQEMCQTCNINS
ncbi:MAG: MarR family transcriptional regulator [Halanaerobiales bacterium]|nr:MarR family transcriptional regulator [Halanaerobiales bacterium]